MLLTRRTLLGGALGVMAPLGIGNAKSFISIPVQAPKFALIGDGIADDTKALDALMLGLPVYFKGEVLKKHTLPYGIFRITTKGLRIPEYGVLSTLGGFIVSNKMPVVMPEGYSFIMLDYHDFLDGVIFNSKNQRLL
jgi:hypothetical protein